MNPSKLAGAIRSTLRLQDMVYNDMLVPEAARGNDNTLWQTYRGGVAVVNHTWAFTDSPKPIELIEAEMRFQWRVFALAAKSIEAHHAAQDRLTWLILWTRETGVLSRSRENSDGNAFTEQAITAQGRIWTDLPFMLQDVQKEWKDMMTSPSTGSLCHNLTAAIARLAAIGLLGDAFSGCGLEIMNQALERPENTSGEVPTVVSEGSEQIGTRVGGESGLTLPFLLPLIQSWLYYAGRKLLQLSTAKDSSDQSGWSINSESTDILPQAQGIDRTGFSIDRFKFWKDELAKLKEHDFEDAATNETAKACSRLIDNVWDEFFGVRARHAAG